MIEIMASICAAVITAAGVSFMARSYKDMNDIEKLEEHIADLEELIMELISEEDDLK